MNEVIRDSFYRLKTYCENHDYKGWDPYDGLSSRLFKNLPLVPGNRWLRLAWIQAFKRSPINFRWLAGVPKAYNAKGLALFLSGYCNLYHLNGTEKDLERIKSLAGKLVDMQSRGYSGSCWGYYFDWQARAFFQPAHTPTVVATSFAADALLNAYDLTGIEEYLHTCRSAADFVLKDLNRTYDHTGDYALSYSPLDHTQVFNASLLGARLLSRVYSYTAEEELIKEARTIVAYACRHQQQNGAWAYGTLAFHNWIDNFHTGFNLECINDYERYSGDISFTNNVEKGFDFYINNFFTGEGASKYYHNRLYPVDIHAPAQLVITLSKLGRYRHYSGLAEKVLLWTIKNMQDEKGYFYYQKKPFISSKIPYMRWAEAWMFYAFSHYLAMNKPEIHGKKQIAGDPHR